ncbi:hypothetical protein D4Z79_19070 [Escherichia coli]|nr:hypothetical protein [Escherichia coli]EEW6403543.1 hypothetical protein [Escherichia coli]EEX0222907.1 hypothetical protein [Escherichia coli]EGE4451962.1 hypothetical protein [Escherichia coli]
MGGGESHAGFMKMAVQGFQGPQNETALAGRHLSGQKGKLLHGPAPAQSMIRIMALHSGCCRA